MHSLLALALISGQTPAAVGADPPGLPPAATAQHQAQFLSVEDAIEVKDGESRRTLRFTRGRYREPLTDEQFLSALGREDQAADRRARRRLSGGLMAGALISFVVTAVVNVWPSSRDSCGPVTDPGFSSCVEAAVNARQNSCPPASLLIGTGISFALAAGGLAARPPALDEVEMRRAADQHNQRLRDRLKGVVVGGRF